MGLVICILGRNSRFMHLSRQLKKMRSVGVSTLIMIGMLSFSAGMKADEKTMDLNSVVQQLVVSPKHAAAFGALRIRQIKNRHSRNVNVCFFIDTTNHFLFIVVQLCLILEVNLFQTHYVRHLYHLLPNYWLR